MAFLPETAVITGVHGATSGGSASLLYYFSIDPDRVPGQRFTICGSISNAGAWTHTIETRFALGGSGSVGTATGTVVNSQAVTPDSSGAFAATFSYEPPGAGYLVLIYTATGGGGATPGLDQPQLQIASEPPFTVPFPINLPLEQDAEFGIDIDVIEDLPPGFTLARGLRNLANALLRRLSTPERYLADNFEDDADYGWDCRRLLNRALTPTELKSELAKAERQVLLDDRVKAADARYLVSGAVSERSVELELSIVTEAGPFRLIIGVDAVTPTLLSVETLE